MELRILEKIKKQILLLVKDTYIYSSENELNSIASYIIKYIKILESKKEKGVLALEVQEGVLHLVENFTDGYIVWLKIHLLNREDYKKIYDILREDLNLIIGFHHSYGINNGMFNYSIFINNRIIDLISDDSFDKEWLKNYYLEDNNKVSEKVYKKVRI